MNLLLLPLWWYKVLECHHILCVLTGPDGSDVIHREKVRNNSYKQVYLDLQIFDLLLCIKRNPL